MNDTVVDVQDIPRLGHVEAMELATAGYERLLSLLEGLGSPTGSGRPTATPGV
jgi:hypothetical protein